MSKISENMQVFYRHYELNAGFPVVALSARDWITDSSPVTRMHFHNCMEIGFLKEGRGNVYVEGDVYPIEAPAVLVVPPNTIHFTTAAEGSLLRWNWIYLNPVQLFAGMSPATLGELREFQQGLSGKCLVIPENENTGIYQLTQMICLEMAGKESHYKSAVRGLFSALFMNLLRCRDSITPDHFRPNTLANSITPAVEYVSAHYSENISVETLAGICHLSTSHFRRLFKQVFFQSPLEYLECYRIERACELLYNCDYSVTQIGMLVGFPSVSSFDRQFTKQYGMSPRQWRNKIHDEENPDVTEYLRKMNDT